MTQPILTSRPTKYRAWTGRELVIVQTLCFNNGGMIWYGPGSHMGWSCVWDSPQWDEQNPKPSEGDLKPVMQWTGAVDKNGVEIYEGDLVRDQYRSGPFLVQFAEGEFKAVISASSYWPMHTAGKSIEVIGNIFTNPDLLKS